MSLTSPVGIHRHPRDGRRRRTDAIEERTREPRDMILLHRHIELTAAQLVAAGIESRHRKCDIARQVVQEGVEVKLLVTHSRYVKRHRLLAAHTPQSCSCIESSGATSIVELQFLDFRRNIISDDEPAQCHDTVERYLIVHLLLTDIHLTITKKGIRIARYFSGFVIVGLPLALWPTTTN